jgi:hypothetical protein
VGAPCFSRGSWTSVQRKAVHFSWTAQRVCVLFWASNELTGAKARIILAERGTTEVVP